MASTDCPCPETTALKSNTLGIVIPCFRDAERAARLAIALTRQALPPEVTLDIVVVDDGSGPECLATLQQSADGRYRVLPLQANQGRAAARNAGARECAGDVLAFLDADCIPLDERFLAKHWSAHAGEVVATTGHIRGTGDGFWCHYQSEASIRRLRQFNAGHTWVGSSSNLAVRRSAFESLRGFDEGYGKYGFEDRDLLIRLSRLGRIAWVNEATVAHLDTLTLSGVTRKMIEAGRYSSGRFACAHPQAYRQLGYGRIDFRTVRRMPDPVMRLTGAVLSACVEPADRLLATPFLPMWLKVGAVRGLSAAAFAYGTLLSAADTPRKNQTGTA